MRIGDDLYCINVCTVLVFEDAGGKGFGRVVGEDEDFALKDDRAGVELFIYEMHGAAGASFAGGEDAFVNVEAGIGG